MYFKLNLSKREKSIIKKVAFQTFGETLDASFKQGDQVAGHLKGEPYVKFGGKVTFRDHLNTMVTLVEQNKVSIAKFTQA